MSRLHNLPVLGHQLSKLNQLVQSQGGTQTLHTLLKKTNSLLHVHYEKEDLKDILQSKPVIITANHPYQAEVLALFAALPNRPNKYLIINARYLGIIPSIDPHLIPVYIAHHHALGKPKNLVKKLFSFLHPHATFSPEEEHLKNIQSIRLASQKISQGGLVVIFPGRRAGKDGKWFSGIGHMITNQKLPKEAFIIPAYIKGSSNWDYFRLVPSFGRFFPSFDIWFGKPTSISKLLQKTKDPKQITTILESDYQEWVERLTHK